MHRRRDDVACINRLATPRIAGAPAARFGRNRLYRCVAGSGGLRFGPLGAKGQHVLGGQGYRFSRPLAPEYVLAFCAQRAEAQAA